MGTGRRPTSAWRRGGWWLVAVLAVLLATTTVVPQAFATTTAAVRGQVVDADGQPVVGADVFIAVAIQKTRRTTTDEFGRYRIDGVPVGRIMMTVRAPRLQGAGLYHALTRKNAAGVDFRLKPLVIYGGRVVDARGEPIAGVRVRPLIYRKDEPRYSHDLRAEPSLADTTDAEGRFSLGLYPKLRYAVRFVDPRYLAVEIKSLPRTADGSRDDVEITMQGGAWVSGHVLDEKGAAIEGAAVTGAPGFLWPDGAPESERHVRLDDGRHSHWVETGPDGAFTIGPFPAGEAYVLARAPGCIIRRVPLEGLEAGKGREGVEIRVRKGSHHIGGRVVDRRGGPLEGAVIELISGLERVVAHAGAGGVFRMTGIHSEGPVRVRVFMMDQCDQELDPIDVGTDDLVVTMKPSPVWTGKVVNAAGELIQEGLTVDVHCAGTWHAARSWSMSHVEFIRQRAGGISLAIPANKATQLVISATGYEATRTKSVSARPGTRVNGGTVRLERR